MKSRRKGPDPSAPPHRTVTNGGLASIRASIVRASLRRLLRYGGFQFTFIATAAITPILAFSAPTQLPSLAEVVKAGTDVWGEAAMREPNGASYEFFENLLPPPRYVNADF